MILLLLLLCGLLVATALIMTWNLWRAFAEYKIRKNYSAALEAPSVSVCIPARNEMHAMTECLESVLASDYEKMEVIVYDDSSADDTSMLIKSFAHAGVRFVPGNDLPEGWLGKNNALEVLAKEASGTYVIFMDVDTRIRPATISQVVGYITSENAAMVSVIPRREDTGRASVYLGTLRYFWQLLLPNRPAVSSSLWMVARESLIQELGGFERFKKAVEPEAALARFYGTGYHCLIATVQLGVSYEKKLSSQYETARRLLYPLFGGRWWRGIFAGLFLLFLNAPLLLVVISLLQMQIPLLVISACVLAAFMLLYGLFAMRLWSGRWWLAALLWPYIILQEFVLLLLSIIGYATHTITWKGRPVTLNGK